jgi:hypothetical protein
VLKKLKPILFSVGVGFVFVQDIAGERGVFPSGR